MARRSSPAVPGERIFRASLLLFPRRFRRRYRAEMVATFRALVRDSDESPVRLSIRLLRDTARAAWRARLRDVAHHFDRAGRADIADLPGPRPPRKDRETMLAMLRDHLRLATRSLRRRPGFASTTILTLGLGIGATTAIFGVVEALLLSPLPYDGADRLVWVQNRYGSEDDLGGVSGAELAEYRQNGGAFEGLAAVSLDAANLTGLDTPIRIQGMSVSREYFDLLGVPFALGRPFTTDEEMPGAAATVIIGHRLWWATFGGDPDVIGRTVVMDGRSRTIIGVVDERHPALAPYLFPGWNTDYWVPAIIDPATFDASSVEFHNLFVLGRLADGIGPLAAEQALRPAVARLEARYPEISSAGNRDVAATPLRERVVGDVGATLWIVLSAVGLLLAVACVNVANMLLARGEARLADVSVHAALGAGRGRLAIQALTESGLIGLGGGALGILLAYWAQQALIGLAPSSFPRVGEIGLDVGVLGFCLAISLLSGTLAGLLPSIRLARAEPFERLKASGRSALSTRHSFLRRALVVGQVAAAVIIASGAALLGRTLLELRRVEPGFDPENLMTFDVNAPRASYGDQASIRALYRTLLDEVEAIPGVASASASWQTPLQTGMSDWPVRPDAEESEWVSADPNMVTNGYFETLGIRLVDGRLFDASDLARDEGAVIVSETAARRLFPDGRAIGRLVNVDFREPVWREIVGIVEDVRIRGLASEPRPQTYFTLSNVPFGPNPRLAVTLRTEGPVPGLSGSLRDIMRRLDPNVPLGSVTSMEDQVSRSMSRERFLATLLAVFAATALVLGALGVYGLLAYDVSRRRREIGLRIAIGARPASVLGRVVRGAAAMGLVGVALGTIGALAASRLLDGFLYGVSSSDPTTVSGVAVVVLAVALLAGYIPARRAARVDPIIALRED